jgi:hypothetical protein
MKCSDEMPIEELSETMMPWVVEYAV